MEPLILSQEWALRLAGFTTVLAAMLAWEAWRPRRASGRGRRLRRWRTNLGLVAVDALVVRLGFPLAAVGAAVLAQERGWGLLNVLDAPGWLAVAITLVILDLAIYAQHVAFHKVPLLWRLHRVHHSDVELDATTGLRFHPIEIALSMAFKIALVLALGAPAVAVIVFEVGLNALAMFNHGNVRLPERVDRGLRRLVVTPDMHRVHHSVHRDETDSNYGFNLSLWDRLFGTYRAEPRDEHEAMTLGLDAFRAPADGTLGRLLLQPFRGSSATAAVAGDKHRDGVSPHPPAARVPPSPSGRGSG